MNQTTTKLWNTTIFPGWCPSRFSEARRHAHVGSLPRASGWVLMASNMLMGQNSRWSRDIPTSLDHLNYLCKIHRNP